MRFVHEPEDIRRRPAMFIGDLGPMGLHRLPFGLLEFPIDQHLVGECQVITLELETDGTCRLRYDCAAPINSVPELENLCRHSAPSLTPFYHRTSSSCFGTNPNGIAIAIALSSSSELTVVDDHRHRLQQFSRGKPIALEQSEPHSSPPTTTITFQPDKRIFRNDVRFNPHTVATRLRDLSHLLPGLELRLIEHGSGVEKPHAQTFRSAAGLPEFLNSTLRPQDWAHAETFFVETGGSDRRFTLALRWKLQSPEYTLLFVNLDRAPAGGSPVEGLRRVLPSLIQKYGQIYGVLHDEPIESEDCCDSMAAVISVFVTEPQWAGATKAKIINPELAPLVERAVKKLFPVYLESNPNDAIAIAQRALEAYRQRQARKQRQ